MIHNRLDITRWESVFSLVHLREKARQAGTRPPDACIITGPYDIALLEQLRDESFANNPTIERVPTDVLVWNRGDTQRREVTKIGGIPYLPADKPWPEAPSGVPMTFMAQFCFADSRDIVPPLPGDILLIFAEGKEWSPGEYDFMWGSFDEYDSAVHFEWVTLGNQPLVMRDDIPPSKWEVMPCWAEIHRTWDYPTTDGFAYPSVSEHIPTVFEATKIGGVCPWLDEEEDIPGQYLCSLSSIHPEIYEPFPFLNVPESIMWEEWRASHPLMLGDVGLINIFSNSYGDIRWSAHGH